MSEIPLFNPEDFTKIKNVGGGSFGTVFLVENKTNHQQYAVKEGNKDISKLEKEFNAFKKTSNPAVLSLLGYSTKNFSLQDKFLLFMEYMPNGAINSSNSLSGTTKYIILLGVALGMKYLHWRGIIHRDLKPGNVLLDEQMHPKICDFGESKVSDQEFTRILMNSAKGTPLYMAPEIIDDDPYNYKVDVYAFSFLAYEIITGKKPFYEKKYQRPCKLFKDVKSGKRPDISMINDEYVKEFLKKCWSDRPSERPSFLEIVDSLMHEQFRKFFGVESKEDIEKVDKYLDLFDDDLKSPNSKDALDWKKKADEGDQHAALRYGEMLYSGFGAIMNKKESIKYFKKAADLGNGIAMYRYAFYLRQGEIIEKNIRESVRYYRKAAEKGNTSAMLKLGHMLLKGDEIQGNPLEAYYYYVLASFLGELKGLVHLANMYLNGKGIQKNQKFGLHFIKLAADLGNEKAMFQYGNYILEREFYNINDSDYKEGMKYLKMSAQKGYIEAMKKYAFTLIAKEGFNYTDSDIIRYLKLGADHGDHECKILCNEVGIEIGASAEDIKRLGDEGDVQSLILYAKMLYNGEGVEKNKSEALEYFKRAADLGDSHAMFELGKMYVSGDGIPEDKEEGLNYINMSLLSKNPEILCSYGQMLRKGEFVTLDKTEALRLIKISANAQYVPGMFSYGEMLIKGEGTSKKVNEGIKWIEKSARDDTQMMHKYGEMLRNGESIPIDKKKAAIYFQRALMMRNYKSALSYGEMLYSGEGIPINKIEGIRLIKLALDNGIKEAENVIEKLHIDLSNNIVSEEKNNEEENNNAKIQVNMYKSFKDYGSNNFLYIKDSSMPQVIIDELVKDFTESKICDEIIKDIVHQNDPNSLYHIFKLKNQSVSMHARTILANVFKRHRIQFELTRWNCDIFFDEKIVPKEVLNILLKKIKRINNVSRVLRNNFDGRQIATYIKLSQFITEYDQNEINKEIQKLLLPKGYVFDKIKYPLNNNIVFNENMILKNKEDFDIIIDEIKKIGLCPVNIERNRLYLYGNYFIRKLFERFSFICFKDENEKMKALNHVNSIAYSSKKNVLKYKLNLHYAKIDDSLYPKIRDNLASIFKTFKGFEDIQEHVLSIENPVERTYVGFDSIKHLKKGCTKFFHYVDIVRYGFFSKIFLKKKNLKYLIIKGRCDNSIKKLIPNGWIKDIQMNCPEFEGNKFAKFVSEFIEVTFIGFDNIQQRNESFKMIYQNTNLPVSIYHEFKTFMDYISNVPEEYLFYDSL